MDEATFSLTGEVVTDVPNSDSIKRALSRGVKAFGVPRHVLTDNGKDYKHLMLNSDGRVFHRRCLWDDEQNRELLSTVYNHLGVFGRHLSRPRHPQSKRIERFFAFLSLRFDPAIVGWRGRGKGDRVAACDELIKKTREAIANRQPVGLEHGTCMTRAEFEDLWARFVAWDFNRERKTGRMKGFAPKEIWESCKTPIRRVGRDALWFLMLKKEGRVVAKGGRVGMSFGGERVEWFSEPLLDMRGEKVDLRIDPDDLDTVFVCDRDKGALLAVAERITKVPAYEEGEKAVTRRELERVAAVNKRLVRATRELGEAREDARQAVANMGAAEFIGIPRGAEYSATPDLSNRPLTPVQTGFETAAKAAVAGRANVAANVKERSSRRAQDRKDGPMSSLLFSTMTRREAEEPLIPLWKDLSNSPMHLEEGE
jgi:hypothetical protein